ncbi:MAG: tetratricopeptide repeat protein [Leeuwenhoekiella sp.]
MKTKIHILVLTLSIFGSLMASAQGDFAQADENPAVKQARVFTAQGNDELEDEQFIAAETSYRRAIAKDPSNLAAKYNAGNSYYKNKRYAEGMARYNQAIEVAKNKTEKHQAFHNLGNALYQQGDFKNAVEAYKNALRNDPTDEETRYNLALAKKEEEQDGGGGGGDDDKEQDQDKDQEQDQDQKGEDKKDENGDPKEEGDEGEEKEDQKNEGDQDEKEDGKPDEKEGENKKPENGEQQPQQPQPGQLSPQQVKSLLEAMKNEENKVQEKLNAEKVKGAKVKSEKDW